jgi:hypothetical protein
VPWGSVGYGAVPIKINVCLARKDTQWIGSEHVGNVSLRRVRSRFTHSKDWNFYTASTRGWAWRVKVSLFILNAVKCLGISDRDDGVAALTPDGGIRVPIVLIGRQGINRIPGCACRCSCHRVIGKKIPDSDCFEAFDKGRVWLRWDTYKIVDNASLHQPASLRSSKKKDVRCGALLGFQAGVGIAVLSVSVPNTPGNLEMRKLDVCRCSKESLSFCEIVDGRAQNDGWTQDTDRKEAMVTVSVAVVVEVVV